MSIMGCEMSWKVAVSVAVLTVGAALLPVMTVMTMSRPREITLVAKDMTFYLEGDAIPNPVIEVGRGETIHVVLRNQERGIVHGFAVPAVKAATDLLRWNEEASVTFDAPAKPGTYEYVCQPHSLMMKGTLRVTP
jgi:plastocyanin